MTARSGARIPIIERGEERDKSAGGEIESPDELEAWEQEVEDCMEKNVPFLLVNGCNDWPIRQQVLEAASEGIDAAVTPQKIGEIFDHWFLDRSVEIPVVHCETSGGYGELRREDMNLYEFLQRLQETVTTRRTAQTNEGTPEAEDHDTPLYGKDWHIMYDLLRQYSDSWGQPPGRAEEVYCPTPYNLPTILKDDWLNFFLDGLGPKLYSSMILGEDLNLERVSSIVHSLPCVESPDKACSDYRFCYLGLGGSWTPIHHDVLCSYSWSANVQGFKLWLLFPPEEIPQLAGQTRKSSLHHDGAPDWSTIGDKEGYYVKNVDYHANIPPGVIEADNFTENCRLQRVVKKLLVHKSSELVDIEELFGRTETVQYKASSIRAFALLQSPGEVVFVPSHWYHQVINISTSGIHCEATNPDVVLSINHNWFNGHAIFKVWKFIEREFYEVSQSLYDCRTFSGPLHEDTEYLFLCEKVMKANCGFHMSEFMSLIGTKAIHLLSQWKSWDPSIGGEYRWLLSAREVAEMLGFTNVPRVLQWPLEPTSRQRLQISTTNILNVVFEIEQHPVFLASGNITDSDNLHRGEGLKVLWHKDCIGALRRMNH